MVKIRSLETKRHFKITQLPKTHQESKNNDEEKIRRKNNSTDFESLSSKIKILQNLTSM